MKDAYFSLEGSERVGCAFYLDKSGAKVAVSEVVEVGKKPQSKWSDLVFIGQVQNQCVKECPLEGDDEDRERHGLDEYEEDESYNVAVGAGLLLEKVAREVRRMRRMRMNHMELYDEEDEMNHGEGKQLKKGDNGE